MPCSSPDASSNLGPFIDAVTQTAPTTWPPNPAPPNLGTTNAPPAVRRRTWAQQRNSCSSDRLVQRNLHLLEEVLFSPRVAQHSFAVLLICILTEMRVLDLSSNT